MIRKNGCGCVDRRAIPRAFLCLVVFACGLFGGAWAAEPAPLLLQPAQDVRGNIQIWSWNIAAASLEKLIPAFQQAYPNVQVRIDMNGSTVQSRFMLSLSAGVGAPDLSQLQAREALRYAVTGKIADLTSVARKYEHAFAPSFWDNCTYEGRVYAIPWDIGPCAIFYKRSVFTKYGIDPESIETWDDYIAAGKTLVTRSGGQSKMLCLSTAGVGLADLFEILLQQSGGQIFDAQGRIAINSPETLETLKVIQRLLGSGIAANIVPWSFEFIAAFKTSSIATYPYASWFGGILRDYAPDTSGDWGLFRLPALHTGGLRNSNLGGSVLVMPEQGRQKDAAWAYAEYVMCTPKAQLAQYRDFDLYPALLATHQDPFFDEPVPFFGGQKARRLFSLDIDKLQTMNRTTDWMEAVRYIGQALSKWATSGQGEPEEILAGLEEKLSRRLNRDIAPGSVNGKGGNP